MKSKSFFSQGLAVLRGALLSIKTPRLSLSLLVFQFPYASEKREVNVSVGREMCPLRYNRKIAELSFIKKLKTHAVSKGFGWVRLSCGKG
jgi:hypothetical protein